MLYYRLRKKRGDSAEDKATPEDNDETDEHISATIIIIQNRALF